MVDISGVNFNDLNSVLDFMDANVGTPLPADFYTNATAGLSASVPSQTTHLFNSGGTSGSITGSLALDDPGGFSHLQSSDVGAFLEDPRTTSALTLSLDSGEVVNGRTNLGDVLNAADTDSLWGQASLRYTNGVSGSVYAVIPSSGDGGRIFGQVELQALMNNDAVTEINGIPKSQLAGLGSIDNIFAAVKASSDNATSFLIGEAYTRGVIGGVTSLDSYFEQAGISTADNDFYRMAVEQVEIANANGFTPSNFLQTSNLVNGLKKAGFVGDAVEVALLAWQTNSLISEGRSEDAIDLLESTAVGLAGGAAGAYGAGVIALALLGFFAPEPSTTVAGAVVLAAAIAGGVGGEILATSVYEDLKSKILAGQTLSEDDFIELVTQATGNCFLAGTEITMADGTRKPIEDVTIGDVVRSYTGTGALVDGLVTQTFQNDVAHVLDVHGLMVTPGHLTLCGDGAFKGKHVPIIDILLSDGALVAEDGSLIRVATNQPVGSIGDQFVKVSYALTSDDAQKGILKSAEIRVGTLLLNRDGDAVSILECIRANRQQFDPETGLVSKDGHTFEPLKFFGAPPKPEDYVLQKSKDSLNSILVDGEWEGVPSVLIGQRLLHSQEWSH